MPTKNGPSYVRIEPRHLQEERVRSLLRDVRHFYLELLLFAAQSGVPGILFAGLGALADELPGGWSSDEIRQALNTLSARGLVFFDAVHRILYLPALAAMTCNRPVSETQVVMWGKRLEDHRCASPVFELAERALLELLQDSPSKLASYLARERLWGEDAKRFLERLKERTQPSAAGDVAPMPQLPLPLSRSAREAAEPELPDEPAPLGADPARRAVERALSGQSRASPQPQAREHPPAVPSAGDADALLQEVWPGFAETTKILERLHRRDSRTLTGLPQAHDAQLRAGWEECVRAGMGREAWADLATWILTDKGLSRCEQPWAVLAKNLLGCMRDAARVRRCGSPSRPPKEPQRVSANGALPSLSRLNPDALTALVRTLRADGTSAAEVRRLLIEEGCTDQQLEQIALGVGP